MNNNFNKSKILLGDSLDRMNEFNNGTIDLIITDPPYRMTKRGKSCRPNYMKNGMGSQQLNKNLQNINKF